MTDKNEFIDKIIIQNATTTRESEKNISVITQFKGKQSVILEVDANTYGLIHKKEKLSIGWRSYTYFNYINILQCFKCCKFGHMDKIARVKKQFVQNVQEIIK